MQCFVITYIHVAQITYLDCLLSPVRPTCIRVLTPQPDRRKASFTNADSACATQSRSFVHRFSMMAPISGSLGPYPFSLFKPFVASDQSSSNVNNRSQISQLLSTPENYDDSTQALSRSRQAISLQKSHPGAVVWADNSPYSPSSDGLPTSVSGEAQGPRKRRLQEHANHPQEHLSSCKASEVIYDQWR